MCHYLQVMQLFDTQVTEAINTKELNGMCTKAWRNNRRDLNVYGIEAEVFA